MARQRAAPEKGASLVVSWMDTLSERLSVRDMAWVLESRTPSYARRISPQIRMNSFGKMGYNEKNSYLAARI